MMSYPAVNHLQYRLKAEGGVTRLAFLHRGHGIDPARTSRRHAQRLGSTGWSAFASWPSARIRRQKNEHVLFLIVERLDRAATTNTRRFLKRPARAAIELMHSRDRSPRLPETEARS